MRSWSTEHPEQSYYVMQKYRGWETVTQRPAAKGATMGRDTEGEESSGNDASDREDSGSYGYERGQQLTSELSNVNNVRNSIHIGSVNDRDKGLALMAAAREGRSGQSIESGASSVPQERTTGQGTQQACLDTVIYYSPLHSTRITFVKNNLCFYETSETVLVKLDTLAVIGLILETWLYHLRHIHQTC